MIKESPIYYSGSKRRSIHKGLLSYFPKDIDLFLDVFCGSGVVSLNTTANKYVINDINKHVIQLINLFKREPEELMKSLLQRANSYKLNTTKSNPQLVGEELNTHKQGYLKLREDYNKTGEVELLYLLIAYSFCHQLRFNSKGEFNMPIGNSKLDLTITEKFTNLNSLIVNPKTQITNKDYKELLNHYIDNNLLDTNSFVYLDPPYLLTLAVYNERGEYRWTEDNEKDLYILLHKLNDKGIRFGLSNALVHRDKTNKLLQDFIKESNCKCVEIPIKLLTLGSGAKGSGEVYVYNY